jgi:hypothetical protein
MRAVLHTSIPVQRFAIFAEMAWMEHRPELGALCRAARDSGGRLDADAVESALPGLGAAGLDNLVSWCRMLGLCDGGGALTALGVDVADTDEAPVPEQGVYCLWVTEHPLLGRRVLCVKRLGSDRGPRFESLQPLRRSPDQGVVFRSVHDPSERFVLRDLPTNHGEPAMLPGETDATCAISWTLDFSGGHDDWHLVGTIESPHGMAAMEHKSESAGIDLPALISAWGRGPLAKQGSWHPTRGLLEVSATETTPDERDSFLRTVRLERVEVPGRGEWSDVSLEDVPLGPATKRDAKLWALDRLVRRVRADGRYVTRSGVRSTFRDLVEETALAGFGAELPAHDVLVEQVLRPVSSDAYWHLAAPVDLAPGPVPMQELAAMGVR